MPRGGKSSCRVAAIVGGEIRHAGCELRHGGAQSPYTATLDRPSDPMETPLDVIEIDGLRLRCVIGCSAEERRDRSDVVIGLRITVNARPAGRSDRLEDAWNYRTPTKAVITMVQGERSWNTVEALASDIARIVVIDHKASHVQVRVRKPGALRFADSVGVTIERTPQHFPTPGPEQNLTPQAVAG